MSRQEKLIVVIVGFSVLSLVAFVLILWAARRLSEPPEPGSERFASHLAELDNFNRDHSVPGPAMAPDEVVRRIEGFGYELGREIIAVQGIVVTVVGLNRPGKSRMPKGGSVPAAAAGQGVDFGIRVVLRGLSRTWLNCYFAEASREQLQFLEAGDEVRVRGVVAKWHDKIGLHLCRIATKD
ncbi:MAG: hypothetical protein V3W41_05425 [Planctomycetota bacterium]